MVEDVCHIMPARVMAWDIGLADTLLWQNTLGGCSIVHVLCILYKKQPIQGEMFITAKNIFGNSRVLLVSLDFRRIPLKNPALQQNRELNKRRMRAASQGHCRRFCSRRHAPLCPKHVECWDEFDTSANASVVLGLIYWRLEV